MPQGRGTQYLAPLGACCKNARSIAGVFVAVLACLWLAGCAFVIPQTMALRDGLPVGLPDRAEMTQAPFFPQEDYQCGPAALATTLVHIGRQLTPEQLVDEVYLPQRRGSLQVELMAAARRRGAVSYQLAPRFEDLLREVAAGNPVIVLQDYGAWPIKYWHYAVVVGYDYASGDLFLRSGKKERLVIPFGIFEYTWKKSDYWAMVTMRPERIPATATQAAYSTAVTAMENSGDRNAAREAFTAFLGRWPDDEAVLIGLSNSFYQQGDLQQTETLLRRAVQSHPDSVAALNNLAQTLSDGGKGKEALEFIDRAVALGGPFTEAAKETRAGILQRLSGQAVNR